MYHISNLNAIKPQKTENKSGDVCRRQHTANNCQKLIYIFIVEWKEFFDSSFDNI